ncbi:MAG: sigma-54-dependent Fis family transcriptional regulator [Verrucomicrobiales bacterium]|nr:sigma-54-dependent Fis family transcriptional regulator [Verrucomicrobiales bacterium]
MNQPNRILLIEDDASLAGNLREVLEDEGFSVSVCLRGDVGLREARTSEIDAVLTDLKLPGLDGMDVVKELHASHPRLPVLLMTAHGAVETAIEATKFGAYDYLQKPFEMPALIAILRRAIDAGRLMRETVELSQSPQGKGPALVGTGRAMQRLYKEIGRVAAKPVSVLIRGETGTGKELVARAIYQHGARSRAAFIAINCAALPENLLESELFGHERGAFTGADRRRIGRFEQAHGGTLFLDEIGDLPPQTQVKLLRVLQQNTFQRLGGAETVTADVRLIAATHRDLETMIREGRFREDLFHRLDVVALHVPALRERREDIPCLVRHFLDKYAAVFSMEVPTVSPEAMVMLQSESWPGNVRELENVTRRLMLAARGLAIGFEEVRQTLAGRLAGGGRVGAQFADVAAGLLEQARKGGLVDAHARMLREAERELLTQAIALAAGNQTKVARWLGLSRFTLREKLRQFGLHPAGVPEAASVDVPETPATATGP